MKLKSLAAFVAALSLAACGHNAGGSSLTPPTSTGGTLSQTATMVFRVVVPQPAASPSALKRPNYVSASTGSVAFALVTYNGNPQTPAPTTVVALTGANCTGSGTSKVCTVTSTEPVGSDTFQVATYSASNGTGTPLSINSVSSSVAAGTNNISVMLNGVVNSLAFSPASVSCPSASTNCTTAAALNALDASGNVIIGSGNYSTTANALDVVTISCQTGLTPETSTSTSSGPMYNAPSNNNLAQVVYSAGGTTAGGSLTCSASDTAGNSATYTVTVATTGSVTWTIN